MKSLALLLLTLGLFAQYSFSQGYNSKEFDEAMEMNDYQTAIVCLNRQIARTPTNNQIYLSLSKVYSKQNMDSLALANIDLAIKYTPKRKKHFLSTLHNQKGDIYLNGKHQDLALTEYSIAIKLNKKEASNYADRGELLTDLDSLVSAMADYNSLIKLVKPDVSQLLSIGRCYYNQTKYLIADSVFSRAIALDSTSDYAYRCRAACAIELKKYKNATDDIIKAIALGGPLKNYLDCLNSIPDTSTYAVEKATAMIAQHPQMGYWYYIRGDLYNYCKTDEYLKAIADYTMALDFNLNRDSYVYSQRAFCLYAKKFFTLANLDYLKSWSPGKQQTAIENYEYGNLKIAQNSMKEGEAYLTKALLIYPKEKDSYMSRALSRYYLKDFYGALADYNNAIELDSTSFDGYFYRGCLYDFKLKDSALAVTDYLKVLKLDTTVADYGNLRQFALLYLHRKDEAKQFMLDILEKYPTKWHYYEAAQLESQMDNKDAALSYLKIAFEKGFSSFESLDIDDCFVSIRNSPEFSTLYNHFKTLRQQSADSTLRALDMERLVDTTSVTIKLEKYKYSNVYQLPCKLNGLEFTFCLDLGASDIVISQTELDLLIAKGAVNKNDIENTRVTSFIADGSAMSDRVLNLKSIDLGGIVLEHISCSVNDRYNGSLLLGMAALGRFGKMVIDNEKQTLTVSHVIKKKVPTGNKE